MRKRDKRKDILWAALTLFVNKGIHMVTIKEIGERANVGIGTIYKYFENKEHLMQELWIAQKKEESIYIFHDYIVDGTIRQRFDFLWRKVINYFLEHKEEYYFSYHFAASPLLTEEIHNIAMHDFLAFDRMFAEGIGQDLFKPMTARQLRLYTFSTINGWLLWTFDLGIVVDESLKKMFLDMAWDALAKNNHSAKNID